MSYSFSNKNPAFSKPGPSGASASYTASPFFSSHAAQRTSTWSSVSVPPDPHQPPQQRINEQPYDESQVPPTLGRVYTQHLQTPGPGRNRYNRLTMPPHELMNDDEQRDTSFAIHTDSRGRAINNVRGHVPTTASNNLTQPVRRPQHNAYSALYPPNSGLVIPQQSADGSPVTNLAHAMFYNQPLPLLQRPLPADNSYQLSQPPQHISNFKHLQYQHSTITPFNQTGFDNIDSQLPANSSSPQPPRSSPTDRIALRRAQPRPQVAHTPVGHAHRENDPHTVVHNYTTPPTSRPSVAISLDHAPPIVQGIRLIPITDLSDKVRQIFPYELFNAVQSKCFDAIYHSDNNIVVSAPTGGGKTALMELAICRLLEQDRSKQFKIVYQAPIKSLCSERQRDWETRFRHLGLVVAELTGDTSTKEMSAVGKAHIIVTTPEKWDGITRNWKDHDKLVDMVKLFLIDEVHILRDIRGATLEAVVSRMKTKTRNVRFVALSATVPNSQDIATWLGRGPTNNQMPAQLETFGEEFRPVKLEKFVYGFDQKSMNDFQFDKILNSKLPTLIAKHTAGKPILVFCPTRKSCEETASTLAEWWSRQSASNRAWRAPLRPPYKPSDKTLQGVLPCGVAFHHAGLASEDRLAVEHGFLKGEINVICCTSTLAMGVNLPCHMAVLKGTVGYQDGRLKELADLEVMQMLGRAGRPQFDSSAIGLILTHKHKEDKYKNLVSGREILESTLHLNLIEHLNSEVSLGTIRSVATAKEWLRSTFLSVRMKQNTNHYRIEGVSDTRNAEEKLETVCERDLKLLGASKLITQDNDFQSTSDGHSMSKYMIPYKTMKLLLSIPPKARTLDILSAICGAEEFKDVKMKTAERQLYRELNRSPFIKHPVKETISETPQKIMIIVEACLGGVDFPKEHGKFKLQFFKDSELVFERMKRIVHCVIDCRTAHDDAITARHAMDLARSLAAGYWENSNLSLRQIEGIGAALSRRLANSNITTIPALLGKDSQDIERILSKSPPFGHNLLTKVAGFPLLVMVPTIVKQDARLRSNPKVTISVKLSFRNEKPPVWKKRKPAWTFTAETTSGKLVHYARGTTFQLEKQGGVDMRFMVTVTKLREEIALYFACEEIVGTVVHKIVKPAFPDDAFLPEVMTKQKVVTAQTSTSTDQFGWDDQDDEFLEAAREVHTNHTTIADSFIDIEELEESLTVAKNSKKSSEDAEAKSTMMENGRWTCNHSCRGGIRSNGIPCKHRCCVEGHDKPRKLHSKSSSKKIEVMKDDNEGDGSNTRIRKNGTKPQAGKVATGKSKLMDANLKSPFQTNAITSDRIVEVIDLSEGRPKISYSQNAARSMKKLQALHESCQDEKLLPQLPKRDSQLSDAPDIFVESPFVENDDLHNCTNTDGDDEDDDNLPSLSEMFGLEDEALDRDAAETCTVADVPNEGSSSSHEKLYYDSKSEPEPLSYSNLLYDDELPSESVVQNYDDVFDFDAAASQHTPVEGAKSGHPAVCKTESMVPSSAGKHFKRIRSNSPHEDTSKRRRVEEISCDHEGTVPSMEQVEQHQEMEDIENGQPAWLKDIDPALIAELAGFVDFI